MDCLRGMERARDCGIVDFAKPGSRFSIEEYMHFEQVENGDLNWILPGKFIAFSGPSAKRTEYYGYRTLTPEDYWQSFTRFGVSAVVRLNKKQYDRKRFVDGGFRHYDLYFPDGTCPTEAIIMRFLEIAESEPGALCVHCKAGLGRTGVLIGLYMMKHYGFAANEILGYMRICRPGMVIGPQQHFMRDWEQRMWKLGDAMRARGTPAGSAGTGSSGSALGPPTPPPLAPGLAAWPGDEEPAAVGSRTSPMKSLHSGTRPSFMQPAFGSQPPGNSVSLVRGSLDTALSGSRGGAVGMRGPSQPPSLAGGFNGRLRRSLNSSSGSLGGGQGSYSGLGSGLPSRMGDLSVGARGLPLVPSVPSPLSRCGVPPSSAAVLAAARHPMAATLHTDTSGAAHPSSRQLGGSAGDMLALGQSSPGQRPSGLLLGGGSLGVGPISPGATARLVTAAGQPRKLPAAAAMSTTYANAYRSSQVSGKPATALGASGLPGGIGGLSSNGAGMLRASSSLPAAAAAYGGGRSALLASMTGRRRDV